MKSKPLPDLEILRACFQLEEDGSLIWRNRPESHFLTLHDCNNWNKKYAGTRAGCVNGRYLKIYVGGASYLAHRIVFYMSTGIDPAENMVDHRDLNRLNNSPANLRLASRAQNFHNSSTPTSNTSGIKGVSWDMSRSRWLAQIVHHGTKHAARFDTIEDATSWVKAIRSNLHGEFARHA